MASAQPDELLNKTACEAKKKKAALKAALKIAHKKLNVLTGKTISYTFYYWQNNCAMSIFLS